MASRTDPPPTPASDPESRLDRIARDLSRTWLHGARVADTTGTVKPFTVVTGQQVQVDLPAQGGMNFSFAIGATSTIVPISRADAQNSQVFMTDVLGAGRSKYLSLNVDQELPTWLFQQRQCAMAKPCPPEDTVATMLADPTAASPATRPVVVTKLPVSALIDAQSHAGSLWTHDANSAPMPVARNNWQPAILIRFPLRKTSSTPALPAGMALFEIGGAAQGDRYYIDELGLLESLASGTTPGVAGISMLLQKDAGTPEQITEWTIVRTKLTKEARSNSTIARLNVVATSTLPYVATSGGGADQDADAIRLLQMASITNAGGSFLRATTDVDATTLILVVAIMPEANPDTTAIESAVLPAAANAVALANGVNPDTVRLDGLDEIVVVPASAPGTVSFGWTRTEPSELATDQDKFGYGTISLVDYSARDARGQNLCAAGAVMAISPTVQTPGDSFKRALPPTLTDNAGGVHLLHTGTTAALRLQAANRADLTEVTELTDPAPIVRHYRASLPCYDAASKESPYAPIGDPLRRQVTITPGFRDVFGNRFDMPSPPAVQRLLCYTDALISPAEWPGVRFGIHADTRAGKPCLILEMGYRYRSPDDDLNARLHRLNDICLQLQGVDGDVTVTVDAGPLIKAAVALNVPRIVSQLAGWAAEESQNATGTATPLIFDPIVCDGQIIDLVKFDPSLTVHRAKADYCPKATDLPADPVLANAINLQVTSASSALPLMKSSALPTSLATLAEPATQDPKDEFREIAMAFEAVLAAPLHLRAGFLRDRLNQHQLWLIPESAFPRAAATSWSFATPRPISNKLGTDTFELPDFTASCASSDGSCWQGHPLSLQSFVDQDYDDLGRAAFRLIETESTNLALVTARDNADAVRALLSEREKIALGLATFASGGRTGKPNYLVPLHANDSDFDGAAIERIARDAFLNDLDAFYSLSTIVQLPLATTGSVAIRMFEGTVEAVVSDTTKPYGSLSDVLLAGGETKATLLFDLPPGVTPGAVTANGLPTITSVTVAFNHIQCSDDASVGFNQGSWVELASSWKQSWVGPGGSVPVVERVFPPRPVIQATNFLMPWMDPVTRKVTPPAVISAADASLLARWGWSFKFGVLQNINDQIYVSIRYNEPEAALATPQLLAALAADWQPQTLLQSLIVLRRLQDNLGVVAEPARLAIVSDLAGFLGMKLTASTSSRMSLIAPAPEDMFLFRLNAAGPSAEQDSRTVMKGAIAAVWAQSDGLTTATVTARAEANGNAAFLIGDGAVRNYRASLRLRRNTEFGPGSLRPADPSLIYECAPVESPLACVAQALWTSPIPPLVFDTSAGLGNALEQFFTAVLGQMNLGSIGFEVSASLSWKKNGLSVVTPFSILPSDLVPTTATASSIATFVNDKYSVLLETGTLPLPQVEELALRLRVKATTLPIAPQTVGRTLLEIQQISFPVPHHTLVKSKEGPHEH